MEKGKLTFELVGLGIPRTNLASVGVGAGVGHGKDARAGVLQLEVLILELHSVDGLAASAVPGGEVSALRNIPNYYGSILIILTFVSFV